MSISPRNRSSRPRTRRVVDPESTREGLFQFFKGLDRIPMCQEGCTVTSVKLPSGFRCLHRVWKSLRAHSESKWAHDDNSPLCKVTASFDKPLWLLEQCSLTTSPFGWIEYLPYYGRYTRFAQQAFCGPLKVQICRIRDCLARYHKHVPTECGICIHHCRPQSSLNVITLHRVPYTFTNRESEPARRYRRSVNQFPANHDDHKEAVSPTPSKLTDRTEIGRLF